MKRFNASCFIFCALILIACAKPQPLKSPTEILKVYVDGYNRRDISAMKQTFSKDTIKMYENIAGKNKTSIDELIKEQFEAAPANMKILDVKTGEEKIDGDTATVKARNNTLGESDEMPFVKEAGQWKIALDKLVKNTLEKNSNN